MIYFPLLLLEIAKADHKVDTDEHESGAHTKGEGPKPVRIKNHLLFFFFFFEQNLKNKL